MGKQGPCRHCGVTSTPLWRNGPADKPVLCNACGSRWRTKGSLANYTPMHRRDDIDDEEPRVNKLRPPTSKPKAQKANKISKHTTLENGPFSARNFQRMEDADQSNWSSSGSAVSYSESWAPYGAADANEMTGSAQSHAWESLVPSKKRTCINRPKASPVEKLAKDLNSIMHEEQLYYLSGSSEEDLLYHSETPVGSVEMGSGSVLLRNPCSKALEEESEASSVPLENKSYVTSESYLGSVHSGTKQTSNLNVAFENPKRSRLQFEDNGRRETIQYDNPHIMESAKSPLVSVDLEEKEIEDTGEEENISGFKGIIKPAMKPLKRPHDAHFQSCAELKVTVRSPKRVLKHGPLAPQSRSLPLPKSGYATKDLACTGALNNYSDQDLLLDIPVNVRHTEAELLYQPSQLSSVSCSSTSMGGIAEGELCLEQS